jgi:hypothetical protein
LKRQNPSTPFVTTPTYNGVYDTASSQTLYLFVDLKTDGPKTWPAVLSALQPLLDAKYLTTYNGTALINKPVTVIGTGNTPLSAIQSQTPSASNPRYAFFDANLALLNSTQSNITRFESPIASTDFVPLFGNVRNEAFNDTQKATLNAVLKVAHAKGIGARFWDTPGWPIGTRNAVWRTLYDAGVDLVNVDDLAGAAAFWEGTG